MLKQIRERGSLIVPRKPKQILISYLKVKSLQDADSNYKDSDDDFIYWDMDKNGDLLVEVSAATQENQSKKPAGRPRKFSGVINKNAKMTKERAVREQEIPGPKTLRTEG